MPAQSRQSLVGTAKVSLGPPLVLSKLLLLPVFSRLPRLSRLPLLPPSSSFTSQGTEILIPAVVVLQRPSPLHKTTSSIGYLQSDGSSSFHTQQSELSPAIEDSPLLAESRATAPCHETPPPIAQSGIRWLHTAVGAETADPFTVLPFSRRSLSRETPLCK